MFTSIIGQNRIIMLIERQLVSGRIPHAYLFVGLEGTGRKKTALEIAKFLNCQNAVMDKDSLCSCDECISCRKIEKGIHSDVHLINFAWQAALLDEDASKQNVLEIDTIRELQKKISLKPAEGKWKIFIIEQAEKLNEQARDCLLKTLEEPLPNSMIILISTSLNVFPQTLVSRCQRIRFRHLSEENISKIVNSIYGTFDNKISELANGSVSEAIKILESGDKVELLLELWSRMKNGTADTLELLQVSRTVSKDKEEMEEFISRMILLIQSDLEKDEKFKDVAEFILQCKKSVRYYVNPNLIMDLILLKTKDMLTANH